MNQPQSERLYNLLPAIYRLRDEPELSLKALLAVMENELQILETDIDNLYDNWFIETCDEWVVPYIGALLGVRELYAESPRTYGQERRAYIANTLTYRRRKGTAPVLEQLVRDIGGWRARAVEFFERVATSQNLNHVREIITTVSLRAEKQPELLGTPFEKNVAYTAEVRRSEEGGRYNIPNIGLFIWRLDSYPLERSTARIVPKSVTHHQGCFTFSALGKAQPLFNTPQTETEITHLADEVNVPGKLRHSPLYAELEALRQAKADSKELPNREYFDPFQPVLKIFRDGQSIPPEKILIFDLSKWELPPDSKTYKKSNPKPGEPSEITLPISVAVDPKLGRLAFPSKTLPKQVEVSYAYGFSGDIGGGPYARNDSPPATLSQDAPLLRWYVQQPPTPLTSLIEAVQAWNQIAQLWQPCHDLLHIPLARLEIALNNRPVRQLDPEPNSFPTVRRSDPKLHPEFQAGIVKGLAVTGESETRVVAIAPGAAVNSQGQRLELPRDRQVSLRPFAGQTVLIVISPPEQGRANVGKIRVLPEGQRTATDIPLAKLQVDSNGRLKPPVHRGVRTDFAPGILKINKPNQTLAVAPIDLDKNNPGNTKIEVFPLTAVNSQGQLIRLEQKTVLDLQADIIQKLKTEFQLDLANNPTISVTLYLAPAKANANQVDIVPDGNGTITILDNRSYVGDLTLKIPSARHLQLTAASGYRPHLQGNLSVVGLASSDEEAGEFTLNGCLVEGRLAILGGYLQQLQIDHCTLVPEKGGLTLHPPQPGSLCEEENLTLMAIIRDCLGELRQGLNPSSSTDPASIQNVVTQLTQAIAQEATAIAADLKAAFRHGNGSQDGGNLKRCFSPLESERWQASLGLHSLVLNRTICGPLVLKERVTTLTIRDSIIDKGVEELGMTAIAASTTNANLSTTTVFGRTVVRTLNASDSLFTEQVFAAQRQEGCVRFSYLPNSSQTSPRYRCQPDLALATELAALPAPISSLAVNSSQGILFWGTAGEGVFRGATDRVDYWDRCETDSLSNKIVMSLLAYSRPATGTIEGDKTINYLLAGTTNASIFLSKDKGENWLRLDVEKTDLSIIDLHPFAQTGTGKIKISSEEKVVRGQGTRFTKELKPGDLITVSRKNQQGETQTRKVVSIDSNNLLTVDSVFGKPPAELVEFTINRLEPTNTEVSTFAVHCQMGNGTISVDCNSKQITWNPPEDSIPNQNRASVSTQLKVGDAITVEGQTRTIISINSKTTFTINVPFEMGESPDAASNWERKPFIINNLFAGTGGGGIFRFTEDGKSWTSVNQGLTNRYITSLAVNTKGELFAGTRGGGIFQSTDNGNHWQAINRGLTNGYVTSLQVAHTGQLFAGTAGGGIFQSTDNGRNWKPINQGLTNRHITAIAIVENSVENSLILFAGTDGSGIFRSTDTGKTWLAESQSFPHLEITTLLSVSNLDGRQQIWAGTAVGSILRTEIIDDRWVTVNQGLTHVDEKLLILNRLKPQFTESIYGEPSYAQLRRDTAEEIRTGAEDGAEMGAFNLLKQPQREANIRASLEEYLRFGLEAGIFYMT